MTCECHEINHMSILEGPCYLMEDGSPEVPGKCCQDKVNEHTMTMDEYFTTCKFIPGGEGSLFPDEVFQFLTAPPALIQSLRCTMRRQNRQKTHKKQ